MKFSRTDKEIFYLYPYYPTRFKEHVGVSQYIIGFKNGYLPAIDIFTKDLEEALIEYAAVNNINLKNVCIVIVPSHTKNEWSDSLLKMADILCRDLSMSNYSKALVRVADHRKLTIGGDRSLKSHIDSIKASDDYDLKGKTVYLIDDVTTTGNSMCACAKILKDAGVTQIEAIAIGMTTDGTLPVL